MARLFPLAAGAFLIPMSLTMAQPFSYPATPKGDVVDTYDGVKVPDPYRWLEDDNSSETKAWVEAENKVTFSFLEAIPQRRPILERLKHLWNYERYGTPYHRGGRYFYRHNSGLQNQSALYVADTLEAEPKVLLDPNTWSSDGTVALSMYTPSEDGKLVAYGVSRSGSDWEEFRVRDLTTGQDRDDVVKWVKFSGASWAKDGSGFYYSRFDEPKPGQALTAKNEFQKIYFHRLGTPQAQDSLIYERPDHGDWNLSGTVTDDGHYLIITAQQGTDPKNRIFYKELTRPDASVVELLGEGDATYDFADNVGSVFYFRTNLKAPRFRVISIDVHRADKAQWREIIAESGDLLQSANSVGGQWICQYLHDAHSVVKCFTLEGAPVRELQLPGLGSAGGFAGRREDKETFYDFTSFTEPGVIYRLDIGSGKSTVWRKPKVDFDGGAYVTEQVFARSKDGTRVPLFIVHKRDLKLDGSHPTLLYGYGGFDISLTPSFSVSRIVWLEMGGVFAMANLRGGGEYGAEWHEAGTKLRKQNVFDDFYATAQWLVDHHYTTSAKLAIQGGSNGGLLVGASMTQHPEMFGAALPAVGVMDMLRYHLFTIGWAWKSDYGSSDNPEEFKALYAYSPYHQLKPGVRYPATLITTADHDDRVVPAHSFKFAARLQEDQCPGGPPVLIRIETKAGHGGGSALSKVIETTADQWAFLAKVMDMPAPN